LRYIYIYGDKDEGTKNTGDQKCNKVRGKGLYKGVYQKRELLRNA